MSVIGVQKGIFYRPNGKKLAVYLESLGPIFTKFGQLLSTRTDILDFETAKQLEKLTDNCKPFDVLSFKQIVESELGNSIDNIFAFDIVCCNPCWYYYLLLSQIKTNSKSKT